MTKTVLLVYGSGGHNEEMRRLFEQMTDFLPADNSVKFLSFCDSDVKHFLTDETYLVPSVTDKYSYFRLLLKMPFSFFKIFSVLRKLTDNQKIDFMITTGPGIGVVCALFFKFRQTKIINIETVARLYSKSLTGRAMYYLADYFVVQNKELLKIYKNAIYKGRL